MTWEKQIEEYMQSLTKEITMRVKWLDKALAIEPDTPRIQKELKELQEKFNKVINDELEFSNFRGNLFSSTIEEEVNDEI